MAKLEVTFNEWHSVPYIAYGSRKELLAAFRCLQEMMITYKDYHHLFNATVYVKLRINRDEIKLPLKRIANLALIFDEGDHWKW